MDTKDYLAYKAKGNVTLERVMKDDEPDADAVKVTPMRFDEITGEKSPAPSIEYSISGLKKDRANHVDEIARIDQLLADLESV